MLLLHGEEPLQDLVVKAKEFVLRAPHSKGDT